MMFARVHQHKVSETVGDMQYLPMKSQCVVLKDPSNAPFTTSWYGSLGF